MSTENETDLSKILIVSRDLHAAQLAELKAARDLMDGAYRLFDEQVGLKKIEVRTRDLADYDLARKRTESMEEK